MKSRIYTGYVMHARLEPAKHQFQYPVYVYAFDLDELPQLDEQIAGFGYNRFRPVSLHDKDYLNEGNGTIREKLQRYLEEKGCAEGIARIELVTAARFFGYIFNPVSFYYCYRDDGSIRCIVAEVNNTFHERHLYILHDGPNRSDAGQDFVRYTVPKEFYVSPFNQVKDHYDFHFAPLNGKLDIRLNILRENEITFRSRIWGSSIPMTSKNILQTIARYPARAWLTMPRILWQAGKLYYLKNLKMVPKPNPTHTGTIRVAKPTYAQSVCMNLVKRYLSNIQIGSIIMTLPNQETITFGDSHDDNPATLSVRNYNFFKRVIFHGDVGFGEAYVEGDWDSDDVTHLLKTMIDNYPHLQNFSVRWAWAGRLKNRLFNLIHKNTLRGSRQNIHAHYDLSNELYRSFLDSNMMYSCAVYNHPNETLDQAQQNKINKLIEKARIQKEDHVLEIGSGWGGFAIEVARQTGCRVTTITLSEEQFKLARERVHEAGLEERIALQLCDYRNVKGQYDKIVSIEMIEAVGHEYLGTFFKTCDRLLKPNGICVIQTITIPDQRYHAYRTEGDWIQKYIFPGAVVPSLTALCNAMTNHSSFMVENLENIGIHYARTLQEWRFRVDKMKHYILSIGFDERFLRIWNYYLHYCEAGFASRILNNLHLVLTRPNSKL